MLLPDWLACFTDRLVTTVVAPGAWDRLLAMCPPISDRICPEVYLELALGGPVGEVDLALELVDFSDAGLSGAGPPMEPLRALYPHLPPLALRSAWWELDLIGSAGVAAESYYLGCDPLRLPAMRSALARGLAAARLVADGGAFVDDLYAALPRLHYGSELLWIGAMGRGDGAKHPRLVFTLPDRDCIVAALDRLGFACERPDFPGALLAALAPRFDRVQLSIDYAGGILPRVGVEYYAPASTRDPWPAIVVALESLGLADPDVARAVGPITHARARRVGGGWQVVALVPGHIKVVFTPTAPPAAKIYLSLRSFPGTRSPAALQRALAALPPSIEQIAL